MPNLVDYPCERLVIGGIYQHGQDGLLEVCDFLNADSFVNNTNQALFKCLEYLINVKKLVKIDHASLLAAANELQFGWILHEKEEINYLRSVVNSNVELGNIRTWGAKLRRLQIARMLSETVRKCDKEINSITGNESLDQLLGLAENPILEFASLLNDNNNVIHVADDVDEYLNHLEDNPVDQIGISTGYKYYDKSIGGGLRNKCVSLLGARVKVGKSIFSINVSLHVAGKLQIPVLYLDTEMCIEDQRARILANISHRLNQPVTINEIETGQYSKDPQKRNIVRDVSNRLKKTKFYYKSIAGQPFEETLSIMRRWIHKEVGFDSKGCTKPCLIIYDYVKLMSSDAINSNLAEFQALGFLLTSMHNFAVRMDVPIFGLIQLNRDGIDRESTDVASGSDRIIWLASNFAIYKNKSAEEIAVDGIENGSKKLVPIVSRHGEGLQTGDYISMYFDGKYARIIEGETKNNLEIQRNQNGVSNNSSSPNNNHD